MAEDAGALSDMTPQPTVNPDAQATVNDFLDYTEFFPSDLQRSLRLIKKLDLTCGDAVQTVHELTVNYGKLPAIPANERPDPTALRREIATTLEKAIQCRESTFAEASRLYEVAERHCQRIKIIKRKLQALPQPPSRDPTPVPVSPQASRSLNRGFDRAPHLRLTFEGGRHGASSAARPRDRKRTAVPLPGARARSLSSSDASDSEVRSTIDLAVTPRKLKHSKERIPKPPRSRARIPGSGTNVHSSIAGISTSNALARLSPPPPDAKPGSKWAPWFKLTEYEMAVLRKKMKKNAVWTPSETMIKRQLEMSRRGQEFYDKEKARCEAAGIEMLDEEPVVPSIRSFAPAAPVEAAPAPIATTVQPPSTAADTSLTPIEPPNQPSNDETAVANTVVDTTANTTADTLVDATANTPVDTTANTLVSTAVNTAANTTADTAANPTVDTPANPTVDTPANPTVDTPTNPTVDTPTNPTVDTPANPTVDTPANPTVDTPANTTADTPANTTANTTANNSNDSSVVKVTRLSKRESQRRQARLDAKELEDVTKRIIGAANTLKSMAFNTPNSRKKSAARPSSKRKRESSPPLPVDTPSAATREQSLASQDSSTKPPDAKRPRVLPTLAPAPAAASTSQASTPVAPSPVANTPVLPETTKTTSVQVPLAPAGPGTPKLAAKPQSKTTSRHVTPAVLSPTSPSATEPSKSPVVPAVPPQTAVTAASTRPRRESVAPKAASPPPPPAPPVKVPKSLTPAPESAPPSNAQSTRPRSARGHVPTPKAQSEEPKPHEPGKPTRELRRHSIFSQSAIATPTRMSTRKKPPPKGDITAGEDGQKTVTNVKRAQGNKNKKRKRTDEDSEPQEEIDPDEPRYCICDDVSFGQMISCDNNCEKEWFHLECVGMTEKDIPSRRAKWYCPDCRAQMNTDAYGNPLIPPALPGRRGHR